MEKPIFLGMFEFVNIWPVYYHFLFSGIQEPFQIVKGNPNELASFLSQGVLAASCIPSIRFPAHKENISLLSNLGLATRLRARSVLLVAKRPMGELSGKNIFVPESSSTSVALLKILLHKMKLNARIIPDSLPLSRLDEEGEAALLIGDSALVSSFSLQDKPYYFHDLGEIWRELTGLPFVWALWGIGRNEARAGKIHETLTRSMAEGMANLDVVASAASKKLDLPFAFLKAYYQTFHYVLDETDLRGLSLFYNLAADLDIAPSCGEIEFTCAAIP